MKGALRRICTSKGLARPCYSVPWPKSILRHLLVAPIHVSGASPTTCTAPTGCIRMPPRTPEPLLDEKSELVCVQEVADTVNPVVETSLFALQKTNVVQINDEAVHHAARHIYDRMLSESYSPRTWRTHPLHICPPEPYDRNDPLTKAHLDWIFLISALNFSFWSEKDGQPGCFAVDWYEGWDKAGRMAHTGYWSLVAALNRALEEDIPITDPAFYSSEILCPDSLITHVFRPAAHCTETIPLLQERIAIMREVGFLLCATFGGSFQGFIDEFHRKYSGEGTALQLVQMVTETFPSFRDETWFEGRRVFLWKRAQILVAEIWAAFYPAREHEHEDGQDVVHPLFPRRSIDALTMFADYRVPQVLHHLRILAYPPALVGRLREGAMLAHGGREELSIRAAGIVAVERVREEIASLGGTGVNSVLIDFYLWDLGKRLESGDERIDGIETVEMVPAHRTRSIWY